MRRMRTRFRGSRIEQLYSPRQVWWSFNFARRQGRAKTSMFYRQAHTPIFCLLRGDFQVFTPQGRHVAPMRLKFGVEDPQTWKFYPIFWI